MSPQQTGAFDVDVFWRDLTIVRRTRGGVSLRRVAEESGLNHHSVLSNLGQGNQVSLDTFLRLLAWMTDDREPLDITRYCTLRKPVRASTAGGPRV